jgi:hypothetical protein
LALGDVRKAARTDSAKEGHVFLSFRKARPAWTWNIEQRFQQLRHFLQPAHLLLRFLQVLLKGLFQVSELPSAVASQQSKGLLFRLPMARRPGAHQ